MSRLIVDTTHCPEFAARIVTHEDGEQQVIPLYAFEARLSYRYGTGRDWLDEREAQELAALTDAYWRVEQDLEPRIRRAIRHCERASQVPFLAESEPRIVTGLEAVLTTSESHVSKQFRQRVSALAQEVGVDGVSKRLADRMYTARSQAYHGDEVSLFSGHPGSAAQDLSEDQRRALNETRLLQRVLQRAVRKSIEDPEFRRVLADPEAVRARWPVAIRSRWFRRRHI
jgi:hypothetical protein